MKRLQSDLYANHSNLYIANFKGSIIITIAIYTRIILKLDEVAAIVFNTLPGKVSKQLVKLSGNSIVLQVSNTLRRRHR